MKYLFLILLLLLFSKCVSPSQEIFEIDPNNFTDNKFTLSEIADDIKYIPLNNEIKVGMTYKLVITENNIFLSSKEGGILKYDKSGDLICIIGKRGRGPGEYIYGMEFSVDETTGNVFVLDSKCIKVYSGSGIFVRELYYREYFNNPAEDIEVFNSFLFLSNNLREGDTKLNWIILDTLGNVVSKKENSITNLTSEYGESVIYKFEDKISYLNLFNDTIFSISPDLNYKTAYLFSDGKHRVPKETMPPDLTFSLFKIADFFETKNYIFIHYSYFDKHAIALIDKKTKKTFLSYNVMETPGKVKTKPWIQNDIDGGLPLDASNLICYYKEDKVEYIANLIDPFYLEMHLKKNKPSVTSPALEKLAGSINNTDNPIIMIVRLSE